LELFGSRRGDKQWGSLVEVEEGSQELFGNLERVKAVKLFGSRRGGCGGVMSMDITSRAITSTATNVAWYK
jgi:hypothetical protein